MSRFKLPDALRWPAFQLDVISICKHCNIIVLAFHCLANHVYYASCNSHVAGTYIAESAEHEWNYSYSNKLSWMYLPGHRLRRSNSVLPSWIWRFYVTGVVTSVFITFLLTKKNVTWVLWFNYLIGILKSSNQVWRTQSCSEWLDFFGQLIMHTEEPDNQSGVCISRNIRRAPERKPQTESINKRTLHAL
jgi:hypothetical protein